MWIPCFGLIPGSYFLVWDSWVWIPGFGFPGLGFLVLDSWLGFLDLDSWVWIPGFGFLSLESWAWIPGLGFLGLESWIWSPGLGFLDLDSWPKPIARSDFSYAFLTKFANPEVPPTIHPNITGEGGPETRFKKESLHKLARAPQRTLPW